jgi:hypothetical protein
MFYLVASRSCMIVEWILNLIAVFVSGKCLGLARFDRLSDDLYNTHPVPKQQKLNIEQH